MSSTNDDWIMRRMSEVINKDRMSLNTTDLAVMQAYANIRVAQAMDKLHGDNKSSMY